MDYTRALGAELRKVHELEYEGKPARAIEASRVYSTDREDLWDALTNPERIPRWFLPVSGELKLGGRYQLEGNAGGTITRCDPPGALQVTWEFDGNMSWVHVRLEEADDGTRMVLVHTFPKDEASEKHWATYGPGATGVGWDLSFAVLGLHLESGGPIDPAKYEGSDDGKALARRSAESWGRAHAESGEDAGTAEAMAARIASFYSGE